MSPRDSSQTPASTALRDRTAAVHDRLEKTPAARALARGRLPPADYVELLRATRILVATLETGARRHGSLLEVPLLDELGRWVGLLDADLESLEADPTAAREPVHDAALAGAAAIRRHLRPEPAWILGFAYVLFGSHRGNRAIAGSVADGLDGAGRSGTAYLRATEASDAAWERLRDLLDRELASPEELEAAMRGATEAFGAFERIFEALGGEDAGRTTARVTSINPEAGDHPIVRDPEHLRVALAVGKRSHRDFGYLVLRYGERGERYARSDGAWLPTLCDLREEVATQQVEWLAGLLSARGVPSICLEHHLRLLHRALVDDPAPAPADVDRLERLARVLADRRSGALPTDLGKALRATPLPALDPRGADVLVSAACDQRLGLAPCADRVRDWLETTPALGEEARREALELLERAARTAIP